MPSLEDRVAALERRVAELVAHAPDPAGAPPPLSGQPASDSADADVFWALRGLAQRVAEPGAVLYTGSVTTRRGPVEWQYGHGYDDLVDRDWAAFAPALAALAHPVRLAVVHAVLTGLETVAELSDAAELGSTGQAYHHLGQLVAAGWLAQGARGRYLVPADRVVPLLVVIAAAGVRS